MQEIDKKAQAKKMAALKNAMKNLAKTTKKEGLVQILGDKEVVEVERIPTSFLTLDIACGGGGVPRGRIVELFGAESSGKSLIAQKIIGECQRHGGLCAYVDMEFTFDTMFAKKLGVDTDSLVISQPDSLQQALTVIDSLIDAGVDVIVLDSIASLVPEEELEAEVGKATVGLVARYLSQFFRRITGKLAHSGTVLICINQVRDKVGGFSMGFGKPEETPGGRALKFYSSLRMRVSKNAEGMLKEKHGGEETIVGQGIKVKIVKNKTAPPFKVAEFKVFFDGRNVSDLDEIVDVALAKGLIPRYNAKGEQVENGRQYRWPNEPEFLAKSKGEIKEQLEKFPNVKQELLDIIISGNYEEHQFTSEELDSDMDDEDFEEKIHEDANSEAEEIEDGNWDKA